MTVIPERLHREELEVDARALGNGQVQRFLETCQVPAAEAAAAVGRSGEIVAVFGTALLQVELSARTATVVDVVPGSAAQAEAAERAARRRREPLRTI
jgi:hypothetical protein